MESIASQDRKVEIVSYFLGQNILLSEDAITYLASKNSPDFIKKIASSFSTNGATFLNADILLLFEDNRGQDFNWEEIAHAKARAEKFRQPDSYGNVIS